MTVKIKTPKDQLTNDVSNKANSLNTVTKKPSNGTVTV